MGSDDASGACSKRAWHLLWQAAEGQSFLPTAGMAARIKERLVSAHQKRDRALIYYVILPAEIHLISEISEDDSPGEIAGAIGNFVSRWVREVRRTRGHVMSGPFHPSRLESDDAIRHEIRMLAWRPVRLGPCRGPTFYAHGALRVALGMRRPDGFDARPLLHYFGHHTTDARPALASWVSGRPLEQAWHAWELSRGLVFAPSHEGPEPAVFRQVKTQGAAALVAAAGTGGIQAALGLLVDWVGMKVAPAGAVDLLSGQDAHAVRGRALVARLAIEHRLCSSAAVARYFKRAKATLSEQVAASRARADDTAVVATPVARIIEDLRLAKRTSSAEADPGAPGAERS